MSLELSLSQQSLKCKYSFENSSLPSIEKIQLPMSPIEERPSEQEMSSQETPKQK